MRLFSIFSVLFLLTPALADNVRNDLSSAPANRETFVAGESTVIGFKVTATTADDSQAGCNASDGTPAIVRFVVPEAVSAELSMLSFEKCNSVQSVTLRAFHAGAYPITATVEDVGGGVYNVEPAAFILTVLPSPDRTPPRIVIVSPVAGATYIPGEEVRAAFTVTETGSGLGDVTATVPAGALLETSSPGTYVFTISARDRAGNAASASVAYSVHACEVIAVPRLALPPRFVTVRDRSYCIVFERFLR